jgi:hypothetical protein
MEVYDIRFDLKDGVRDTDFAENASAYLDHLKGEGAIAGYRVTRRKLGLGPPQLPHGISPLISRTWRRWTMRSAAYPDAPIRSRASTTRSIPRSKTSSLRSIAISPIPAR